MMIKKLSLWVVTIALGLAVKLLLSLSRFFEALSQYLHRGIVYTINALTKGNRP